MNYDMNALYLYSNGYRYEVGSIEKVNEKTIRMTSNTKINKEDFDSKTYKLTEEEFSSYKGELIKKLSNSQYAVKEMIAELNKLRTCLNHSCLVEVNVEKLQSTINNLEDILARETPQPLTINGTSYKFDKYCTSLEKMNNEQM